MEATIKPKDSSGELWAWAACLIVLCSAFVFPPLYFREHWPAVRLDEICFPILCLVLFQFRSMFTWRMLIGIALPWILFAGVMILSIIMNDRIRFMRDHFEWMRELKYLFVLLVMVCCSGRIDPARIFFPIILFSLVFNVLHYFNVADFNHTVLPWFAPDIHIDGFGVNSLGEAANKRILGVPGNPNNNALIFLLPVILFSSRRNSIETFNFFGALALLMACQSKTAFAALGLIYVLLFLSGGLSIRRIGTDLLWIVGMFAFHHFIGNRYLSMLGDPKLLQSGSVMGRLQIWGILWDMIRERPVLGHGPYKEFFTERNLYPEGEYILMWWRYGCIGLLAYLFVLLKPMVKAFTLIRKSPEAHQFFIFSAVMLTAAITNAPFLNANVIMAYLYSCGLFFYSLINSEHATAAGRN